MREKHELSLCVRAAPCVARLPRALRDLDRRGAVGEALQRGWKLWDRVQTNGASSISVVVLYTAFEVKDRQINLRTTDVTTEHHGIRRWLF